MRVAPGGTSGIGTVIGFAVKYILEAEHLRIARSSLHHSVISWVFLCYLGIVTAALEQTTAPQIHNIPVLCFSLKRLQVTVNQIINIPYLYIGLSVLLTSPPPIWSSAVLNKTRQDETSLTGSSHQFPDLLERMYMKTSQKDDCERRFLPCHYYVKTAVRSWFLLALFLLSHPWGTVLRLACCSPFLNKWTSCRKKGNFRTFFWVWRGNLWQQHSAADACLLTAGFLLIVLLSHSLKVAGLCWTTRSRTWLKWKTRHLMRLHIGFCCSSGTSACTFVSFLVHWLTFWLDRVNMQTLDAGALYY